MLYYIIIIIVILFILFISFLILLKNKLSKLENIILGKFKEKNNQIPSLYESTNSYLNKHNEIFEEILILKKKDFSENLFYTSLLEKTKTYKLIHNELNFIFRACNKHPKIHKDTKFLLVKDIIIDKSMDIGKKIELYKNMVNKYNNLIKLKNITIIGLLIPIHNINIL